MISLPFSCMLLTSLLPHQSFAQLTGGLGNGGSGGSQSVPRVDTELQDNSGISDFNPGDVGFPVYSGGTGASPLGGTGTSELITSDNYDTIPGADSFNSDSYVEGIHINNLEYCVSDSSSYGWLCGLGL